MSKKPNDTSIHQEDLGESDSVYDFLYQDARRVGSFLAQLNPTGHVQGIKRVTLAGESEGSHSVLTAGLNAAVAKTALDVTTLADSNRSKSLEQTLDPLWTNAIDLLNLLTDRGILSKGVQGVGIGHFVLVTGVLAVIDLSNLKMVWDVPELRSFTESAIAATLERDAESIALAQTFAAKGHKTNTDQAIRSFAKMMVTVFKSLPSVIQGRLADSDGNLFYFNLSEDGLISSPTELFLKHGVAISGEWSALGILDAQPDEFGADNPHVSAALRLNASPLTMLLKGTQAIMRQAGRPQSAYGITPLLIFRSASG